MQKGQRHAALFAFTLPSGGVSVQQVLFFAIRPLKMPGGDSLG